MQCTYGRLNAELWQNQFSGEPKRLLYLPIHGVLWTSRHVNSELWIHANMNPDINDHINDPEITLKGLIEQAGTNQRQLSRDSGIAEVTINSWVAGKYSPKLDSATLVAKALGVSLKSLAKSMRIDVTGLPDDYSLIDLKLIASELGIERIEDLPEDYRMLKRRRDLMRGQQN